jgi:hypothetical protein
MLEHCAQEHARILKGRRLSSMAVHGYRLRRVGLLLASGHFYYVGRSLLRKAMGVRKDLA